MNHERIAQAIADLDAWLETMRQPCGYGGPVAHWWQSRFQYTGPGLDWRYEGILIGYTTLVEKQPDDARWRERVNTAARDLIEGQRPDGSYLASRFEINPATLGTPHEAAATLGLLSAIPLLEERAAFVEVAKKNLRRLVDLLWDGQGFNDRAGGAERVPNKLATFASAFIHVAEATGDDSWLAYARSCLDDVVALQVRSGPFAGAVHQIGRNDDAGDGRFFPFYNARCVPPLLHGASALNAPEYEDAAEAIGTFLDDAVDPDGAWPQVIYGRGRRSSPPRWLAGVADILMAQHRLKRPFPAGALARLLDGQLPSGGFRTAEGFGARTGRDSSAPPDLRDVIPVVGWNDKVLAFLAGLLEHPIVVPQPSVRPYAQTVRVHQLQGSFHEDATQMQVVVPVDRTEYLFAKAEPWASICGPTVNRR